MSDTEISVFGTLGGVVLGAVLGFAGTWYLQNQETQQLAEGIRLQLGAALYTVGIRMLISAKHGAQPLTGDDWQAARLHEIAFAPETASALKPGQLLGVLSAARAVQLSEASIRYSTEQLRGASVVNLNDIQERIRKAASSALESVNFARKILGLSDVTPAEDPVRGARLASAGEEVAP